MCLYVDDDTMTLLSQGTRRARKAHKCDECARVIEPGERYQYWTGLQEGDFFEQKMCAHCWATVVLGSDLTGCPRYWWWDFIHDVDDPDVGFVANILAEHDLQERDRLRMLRTVAGRRRQWRRRDGSLLPVPA